MTRPLTLDQRAALARAWYAERRLEALRIGKALPPSTRGDVLLTGRDHPCRGNQAVGTIIVLCIACGRPTSECGHCGDDGRCRLRRGHVEIHQDQDGNRWHDSSGDVEVGS